MSQSAMQPTTTFPRTGTPPSRAAEQPGRARQAQPNVVARVLGWTFAPALAHRRALLWMNLAYFGAMVAGALYALVNPEIQRQLLTTVAAGFSPGTPLSGLVEAYATGAVVSAIVLTFAVNLVVAAFFEIGVLSAVVPFGGLALGLIRALLWGVLFAPTTGTWGIALLPHVGTMLLEGEAYVLAMLGVWLWWKAVATTPGGRLHAWWTGLKLQARIYVAVAAMLAVAATYEALEVIFVIPRLM